MGTRAKRKKGMIPGQARREKGTYPKPTGDSGKWLIFVDNKEAKAVWALIKQATEDGKLGDNNYTDEYYDKVAGRHVTEFARDGKIYQQVKARSTRKVICVYTYDWTDETDIRRIREELRSLGITHKIPYKSNADTASGKYRHTGHRHFSKYYE